MSAFVEIMQIYAGSDGEATKALYARLELLGPIGVIALNLFRAHKASARAKLYRGGVRGRGSFRSMAYERKQYGIDNLAAALSSHAEALAWGWAEDPKQEFHRWVLYVELPTGQVSFHTADRGDGPDFVGHWDGIKEQGSIRICRWIAWLFDPSLVARIALPVVVPEPVQGDLWG